MNKGITLTKLGFVRILSKWGMLILERKQVESDVDKDFNDFLEMLEQGGYIIRRFYATISSKIYSVDRTNANMVFEEIYLDANIPKSIYETL